MKWLRRISLGVLALAVLVVVGGAAYEAISRANASRVFPPPGRLVDIGGRRIQIDCRGAGSPVVVFEAGLDSMGSLAWSRVHDQVAATTRACAYSRAGVMWSDPPGRPFRSEGVAEDLHKALAAAGEKPPYVMVGHSLGGPYVLTFTGRYGGDVAGLVLVDSSHPDQIARLRAAAGKDLDQGEGMMRTANALAWSGVVRQVAAANPPAPPNAAPAVRQAVVAWLPQSVPDLLHESEGLGSTLATAGHTHSLGDRPLVVLTHGVTYPPNVLKQMKVTAAQGDRLNAEWLAMQNDEASWSTRSRHTVVPGASHYIQFDQPQVVIDAVRDVVAQVRAEPAAPAQPPAAP